MSSGKTILLVEDDPDLLDFTGELLQKRGYRVLKAEDADSAFHVITEVQVPLDLLLSDIRLPGELNGVELAKRAVAIRPELKVLLASGYDSYFVNKMMGSFSFIEKPYYPNKLDQAIQTLIGAA